LKEGIHPNYLETTITCACGNSITTRSTKEDIKIEICSACHPFFTGKQKLVDSAGRVDRFLKRYGLDKEKQDGESEKSETTEATETSEE
jgi:large subunit ribosomal protein L31